jgi:tellurite resistance protein
MTALYDALNAAIAHANEDGNADENEQEVIDSIQKKIDAVKDA